MKAIRNIKTNYIHIIRIKHILYRLLQLLWLTRSWTLFFLHTSAPSASTPQEVFLLENLFNLIFSSIQCCCCSAHATRWFCVPDKSFESFLRHIHTSRAVMYANERRLKETRGEFYQKVIKLLNFVWFRCRVCWAVIFLFAFVFLKHCGGSDTEQSDAKFHFA